MPRKIQKTLKEHNALVQAIETGMPRNELMENFGLSNYTQLKGAYIDALIALGKVVEPEPGAPRKKPVDPTVTIGAKGNLVIPKKLIEALNIDTDVNYEINKSAEGLWFKPVKPATNDAETRKPATVLRKKTKAPEAPANSPENLPAESPGHAMVAVGK